MICWVLSQNELYSYLCTNKICYIKLIFQSWWRNEEQLKHVFFKHEASTLEQNFLYVSPSICLTNLPLTTFPQSLSCVTLVIGWTACIINAPLCLIKQDQAVGHRPTRQRGKTTPAGMGLFLDQNHISHVSAARLVFAMNRGRNDSTQFGVVRLTFMLLQSLSVYDVWKAFSSLCFSVRGCPAALAVCSEAYFSAVAKMGDQALHTLSSRSLGKCVCVCDCVWDWSLSLSITGFALNLLHQFNRIVL